MSKKVEVGIIGLGKFGLSLAITLGELGISVVGVDNSEMRVKAAKPYISQVYQADGTDSKALEQLSFQDLNYVVVSTGDSMDASILVVLNLQEMGVDKIWVKAISEQHQKVLKRLGVDFVVFPEQFVAKQLAHRLAMPGMLEYLSMGDDVIIRERRVGEWKGKNLAELNLTNNYQVQVIAIRKAGEEKFSFVPNASELLEEDDVLVIMGSRESVMRLPDASD
ncbi:potassium channel family protein [Maridesulfovibrio bastinii]|uniref:potassium channel family protein n=1 Tax=Maridesulfovibrio bastinii TaxID=47157 RepID=UPI000400EAC7|nr:TrkA family potassium uptake protein [Maridesulfovibrio bastinii]